MSLTATKRFPAQSGLAPAPHCIGDKGVFGGSVPCQSQSQTVPNEPSPRTLRGVYERVEPGWGDQNEKERERERLTALGRADDETVVVDGDTGDADDGDGGLELGSVVGKRVVAVWDVLYMAIFGRSEKGKGEIREREMNTLHLAVCIVSKGDVEGVVSRT